MRKLYFLLPGTKGTFGGGGLWAELKTLNIAKQICQAEIVTYRQKENEHLFLSELLSRGNLADCIFIVSWGFDVPKLVAQLRPYNIVYHAHSSGYRFRLPTDIPIIAVSRNTMGYWGEKSPNTLIYLLPNQIGEEFTNLGKVRDIDVLVQVRKSSNYLLNRLLPQLRNHCHVQLLDGYVEDLAGLFNRSKIYLYDSAEYWAVNGLTEGFGLPPLEALACGCQVFSSVNSALADYLDPGLNCYKIGAYSLGYDVQRILGALKTNPSHTLGESFWAEYRAENLLKRLEIILEDINLFFDIKAQYPADIEGLEPWRVSRLWLERSLLKLQKKLKFRREK
jgi:glycosyltransferase involved in cell wall biosynthesis